MGDTKLQPPGETVIGKFYNVPCIIYPTPRSFLGVGMVSFVPVLLPAHSDADLGVAGIHYHYDFRFVATRLWERVFGDRSLTWVGRAHDDNGEAYPLEYRRLKCKRISPPFPSARGVHHQENFCSMETKASGEKLDLESMICPHRGICLKGAPRRTIDGKEAIICPGHGLAWDAATGENIARHCDKTNEWSIEFEGGSLL